MSDFAELGPVGDFTPHAVVAACFEQGAEALLIDRDVLPAGFFDLRTGVAGELAQRVALYGIRLACVVPDLPAKPERFVEYARESNRGGRVRFFASRAEAERWLRAE